MIIFYIQVQKLCFALLLSRVTDFGILYIDGYWGYIDRVSIMTCYWFSSILNIFDLKTHISTITDHSATIQLKVNGN